MRPSSAKGKSCGKSLPLSAERLCVAELEWNLVIVHLHNPTTHCRFLDCWGWYSRLPDKVPKFNKTLKKKITITIFDHCQKLFMVTKLFQVITEILEPILEQNYTLEPIKILTFSHILHSYHAQELKITTQVPRRHFPVLQTATDVRRKKNLNTI